MADSYLNLLALLKRIAVEQNYNDENITVRPVSTGGANYSSKLYHAVITSKDQKDLQLFAKIAAMPQKMRDQIELKVFDNERYVYKELIRIYRQLEEKRGLPVEHIIAFPKYYGDDATHLQEILVLEDLASKGFVLQSHLEPVNWHYAAAACTELAKFHALSIAYKYENPAEFDKVIKFFGNGIFTDDEDNQMYLKNGVKSALQVVREENKEKLQAFIDCISLAKFCSMYGALQHPVLIHADFRPSNMMHRLRNDGTVELMMLDYQMVQLGSPVIDLLYFIFLGTDGKFRTMHYQKLMYFCCRYNNKF